MPYLSTPEEDTAWYHFDALVARGEDGIQKCSYFSTVDVSRFSPESTLELAVATPGPEFGHSHLQDTLSTSRPAIRHQESLKQVMEGREFLGRQTIDDGPGSVVYLRPKYFIPNSLLHLPTSVRHLAVTLTSPLSMAV